MEYGLKWPWRKQSHGTPSDLTGSLRVCLRSHIAPLLLGPAVGTDRLALTRSAPDRYLLAAACLVPALLRTVWYDLSDVKLAQALDDQASFRRFCGFATYEATPERTAFVRSRRELTERFPDIALFDNETFP